MNDQVITAIPAPSGPLPEHHKQWFEQLLLAANNGQLVLLSCRDAETAEPRSVIALMNVNGNEGQFIPIGHLATTDNPFDAYIPPEI